MDEFAVGKLLPNLNVSLSNNEVISESSVITDNPSDYSKVKIVRTSVEDTKDKKIYLNKDGGFTTGIDLITVEHSGILSKRAERFGLDTDQSRPSISSLYESMGIDLENRNSAEMKRIRLDAVHVRGVQELETDDVFNYFQDYGPSSLEWIDDQSCNVLWFDEASPARALLGLSKPLPTQFPITDFIKSKKKEAPDESSFGFSEDKEKEAMDIADSSDHESQLPDIAIPPGRWRLGVPHANAKTMLLRFATKDDKKIRGAEKRSNYYKKHGNPNYGGLKGLISSSRKYKAQAEANRMQANRAIKMGSSSSYKSFSSYESDTSVPKIKQKKTLRMRMYADDEELKAKKSRSETHFSERKGNVHSRLGTKYTADDLCVLGTYKNWNQDSSDDKPYYQYSSFKPTRSTWDFMDKDSNLKPFKSSVFKPSHSTWGVMDRDSSSARSYESSSFKSTRSTLDLRSKLKRSSYDSKETYPRQFTQKYDEEEKYSESANIARYGRIDELKKASKTLYKRKHRSPLCDDDDDDGEYNSSSDD